VVKVKVKSKDTCDCPYKKLLAVNQSQFQIVNEKTLDYILWTGKGQDQTSPPHSPEHASAIIHLCCLSCNQSFQSLLSHKMTTQD